MGTQGKQEIAVEIYRTPVTFSLVEKGLVKIEHLCTFFFPQYEGRDYGLRLSVLLQTSALWKSEI